MKRFCTLMIVLCSLHVTGQIYNNEWIDFNKTYYKFKVGKTGLYRISKSMLATVGLDATAAEQFQLFRNGKEIALYTSVNAGVLPANGFIEFWGEANDGTADRQLYLRPEFQHTSKNSLETDTSVFFLTVNTAGGNKRFNDVVNNIAGNTLPSSPYFIHKEGFYFKEMINPGLATVVGEYVYSSSYDKGEFWSSNDIGKGQVKTVTLNNLKYFNGGPAATLRFGAAGNALYFRRIESSINGVVVKDTIMNFFNDLNTTATVPNSAFSSGDTATVSFRNKADSLQDRMVLSYFELNYPRKFDFASAAHFEWELPSSGTGYYLEIENFNRGSSTPVLYDLNSNERFTGDIVVAGKVRFALPPNTLSRKLVLVSMETANLNNVTALQSRNFIDYNLTVNQGDYLIISNPKLYKGSGTNNPVEDYRLYRSSINGGGFKPIIIDIHQLTDQFAYGIKVHPGAIKNFLNYARAKFAPAPKYVLLIGKGVTYNEFRAGKYDGINYNESHPQANDLNLVPTFGWPGSDNLLAAPGVSSPITATPIGRLSVVSGVEIEYYLEKVKAYENVQRNAPNTISDKLWFKNTLQLTGASEAYLGTLLCNYMQAYRILLQDTLLGSNVNTFCKSTVGVPGDFSSDKIKQLFEQGLSMVTYFGHSSSTNLDFNIEDPESYNNLDKYPIFSVNGCNAGNFFTFEPKRFTFNETLSEKFTLAKQKGSIAFIASTHFGIVNYLNVYINALYNNAGKKMYGQGLGQILDKSLQDMVTAVGPNDFLGRLHAEEITLHGDPAIKFNFQAKPDYVIEASQVVINPEFISIAEEKVKATVALYNLGKAIKDSISVTVRRQYPDGSSALLVNKKIPGIIYKDTLMLTIPIVATRDKGVNKLIITVDALDVVSEISETNNTISKEFFVYEDEARPAFPYNFAIVNKQGQKLVVSTANPFSTVKQYIMEIDTTELFDSPLKKSQTISSSGGIIEFDPQLNFSDSTVYYWRVSLVPGSGGQFRWNGSSFIYLAAGARDGFNQSHYFQHLKSDISNMSLSSGGKWSFDALTQNVFVKHGYWVTATTEEYGVSVQVNGNLTGNNACAFASLIFFVFDPVTFKPWVNVVDPNTGKGLYGSWANNCAEGRIHNFEFMYTDTASRRNIINFMDNVIPAGAYVLVRAFPLDSATFVGFPKATVNDWKNDTTHLGAGNSVYHRFVAQGFPQIDSFDRQRTFAVMYKKDRLTDFTPKFQFTQGIYDNFSLSVDCITPDTLGFVESPVFGPAKTWKQLQWSGKSAETISTDNVQLSIIAIDTVGNETLVQTIQPATTTFDVSNVNAVTYPFMKLRMKVVDSVNLTPYQLKYWRLDYTPVPEGAVAPNIFFNFKDTVDIGEVIDMGIVFKNISNYAFDSLKVRIVITDRNNVQHIIDPKKLKPLVSGDTIRYRLPLDTKSFPGANRLFIDFNPSDDQPEQYHFNNFLYRDFYVRPDLTNPLLDVTFDGIHILNRDIVSSRPHIQIKLKDESKYMLLNDTSLISTLTVRFPDKNRTVKNYRFDNDTVRFTPPQPGTDNTAVIDFTPYFPAIMGDNGLPLNKDGDEYELTVNGKDRSGNNAGQLQYKVAFTVIDKPMISNLLNYPNPFTTSTAFVFTITGSEIPTNFKIQILTITGKVVREITGNEIGPLRIGRNITEFKWDGTDQYGQRLANGVYLYRVVSTLNGNKMDKYKARGDDTDKYFNNGYGKMYLMK